MPQEEMHTNSKFNGEKNKKSAAQEDSSEGRFGGQKTMYTEDHSLRSPHGVDTKSGTAHHHESSHEHKEGKPKPHRHSHEEQSDIDLVPGNYSETLTIQERRSLKVEKERRQRRCALMKARKRPSQIALAQGVNLNGDCFCQPCWCCCFNRICKATTAVMIVGFFDGLLNLLLCIITLFSIFMWELHGKHAEETGFGGQKNNKWADIMGPNEDGIYMLLASYTLIWPVSFWMGVKYYKMRRSEPVMWMLLITYSTALQIISLIYFPFFLNLLNIGPLIIRFYEFWAIYHYDYLLRIRPPFLRTQSEIEISIRDPSISTSTV